MLSSPPALFMLHVNHLIHVVLLILSYLPELLITVLAAMETNCSQLHGRSIFSFCDSFGYHASEIVRSGFLLYSQVLWKSFWRSKGEVMLLNICCLFFLENQVKRGGWAFDHFFCFLLKETLPQSLAATCHFKR